MEAQRLFDFLAEQGDKNPDHIFLSAKKNGRWQHHTFMETQAVADRVSAYLLNLGMEKGSKIAIISGNCAEWNFTDLGALQAGIIVVPVYPNIAEKDYEYIFNDAEIKYAFVEDRHIYDKIIGLHGKNPYLENIISFKKIENVLFFWDVLPAVIDSKEIAARKESISGEDLATIIYTSGTTGNPKGVMLSHGNIVSNVMAVKQVTPFGEGRRALSFLPLCHSFERMVFYAYLAFGIHIYYAESLDTIMENLQEVKPYCFTTVPRMLEKVYAKILDKGDTLNGARKKIFEWSMEVGRRYETGKKKNIFYQIELAAARKLFFYKWKQALGGEVEFIITGAAAVQPVLVALFTAAGIPVLEGYGLTETSPVLCCNRVEETDRCNGTVGMPIPGVTIRIAEDGEILAKGPGIMKGYYKQPQLTAEVIDLDGWFHTGDIGEWKDKRFLRITDRKKELFKTTGGKYVAPQVIENKMKESRFIEQVMVVGGDDKKFVSALIVPSFSQLSAWAASRGWPHCKPKELIADPMVKALIRDEVNICNADFGKWEQVKKFVLLDHEWSLQTGELTPTLKIKRKFILEKYAAQISGMYAE